MSGAAKSARVGHERRGTRAWRGAVVLIVMGSIALVSAPAGAAPTPVQSVLGSVTCTGPATCVAVGSYVSGGNTLTLAEASNGSTWTVQPTPNPPSSSNDVLAGVSCLSATSCLAVGSYFAGSGVKLLAEVWNGTAWSLLSAPLPAGGLGGGFNGVSCSGTTCTAVGDYANASNTNVALAESWDGTTFAVETVPAPGDAGTNTLTAVSCSPAPSPDCEAVGWYYIGGMFVATTLAEGWNGTAWSVQSAPLPPNAEGGSYPTGISCAAPHACTSVGEAFDGGFTLRDGWAQRWNGKVWANENVRAPKGSIDSAPSAISCSAAPSTACTTIGQFSNGSTWVAFAEGRNGTKWKPQKTPEPKGSTAGGLLGVSCQPSGSACTAVGDASNGSGVPLTLAEAWNGTKWTIEKTPVP